jgi:predicted dienelactone hydrolase
MADHVGYRSVELTVEDRRFLLAILYPTDAPEETQRIGPYSIEAARDAAPKAGRYPLVMISHGRGGTPWVYRTLATHLARNGFIVGAPEHPGDNRSDNSLENTYENLGLRPKVLGLSIDWIRGSDFAPCLKADSVSLIGHSLGTYTILAVAGGLPAAPPHQSPDGKLRPVDVTHDHRINALVLLAPATWWYQGPGALRGVDCPILMMGGEKDEITPPGYHAEVLLNGVLDRSKVTYRLVENGGHFSFLSPFPEFMRKANFPPAHDPEGFERELFLETMNAEIVSFLRINA